MYFAGPLYGPWQFGAFQATAPAFKSGAYFLTRLHRTTGTFQWLREPPAAGIGSGTEPAAEQPLATDAAGNAWLLTNTRGTSTWPGFGPRSAAGRQSVAVLGYDPAGTLRAVQVAGGPESTGNTLLIDIAINRAVIAGVSRAGGVQFAPLAPLPTVSAAQVLLFTAGFRPVFALLGTRPEVAAASFGLSPNPVAPGVRLQLTGAALTEATLFDGLGRLVARYPFAGAASAEIPAPARAGLYLVRFRTATGTRPAQRLVVE